MTNKQTDAYITYSSCRTATFAFKNHSPRQKESLGKITAFEQIHNSILKKGTHVILPPVGLL